VGKKGTLRDFSVGFAEPFVQFCAQCGGSLGLARGEVVAFADVGREIVELIEPFQHAADGGVHVFDQARVDGVILHRADGKGAVDFEAFGGGGLGGGLGAVFSPKLFGGLEWAVHRVEGEVSEEGLFRVLLDEGDGFVGQALSERLTVGAARQAGIDPRCVVAAFGTARVPAAFVDVEAAIFRP
jgi:hypothetical protein